MATRTIKPQREDTMLSDYESLPDTAPSVARQGPAFASQIALFVGFFLLLVGALAIVAPQAGWTYPVSAGWGYFVVTLGLGLMLMHCYLDTDPVLRRMYGVAALAMIAVGTLLRLFAYEPVFLGLGLPLLLVALLFLIGVVRVEDDARWSRILRTTMLAVGGVMILCALAFGFRNVEFLSNQGVPLLLLGLAYIAAYIGVSGESDGAFRAGVSLAAVGGLCIAIAVVGTWFKAEYLVPAGLFLGAIGVLYLLTAGFAASDRPFFVMTRRELASFFYSPIAYLVLFGLIVMFWLNFMIFLSELVQLSTRSVLVEPIIDRYVFGFLIWITVLIMVPILTMRSFSEERRTGSLEMLMTAPVREGSIVLSKFFATYFFYLLAWVPFFVFAISFRVFGVTEYDYRPLLSFFVAMAASGAGFIAVGLFVSSLTSNQIVSAVVTTAAMVFFISIYFISQMDISSSYRDVLEYVSFVRLWERSGAGLLQVRSYLFHLSLAIFFLYLTYLNLTARKWK